MFTPSLLDRHNAQRHLRHLAQQLPALRPNLTRIAPRIVTTIGRIPRLRTTLSRWIINDFAYATPPRPRPLSLASDYTTWTSLTDRSYSGRHLPPSTLDEHDLPTAEEVLNLFRREHETKSTDTSATFMFFAQWFADAFLRTNHRNPCKNTSTQEIDLCQIYGLRPTKTHILRSHAGGRLKSQFIDNEEYPPFLFTPRKEGAPLTIEDEFQTLFNEQSVFRILSRIPDSAADRQNREDKTFATGLEYGNTTIGHTILNTIFLREHNRIADIISDENPNWEESRKFETARNVMIVLLIKVVVEDYIRHIAPFDFPIKTVPFVAENEQWNRSNWAAIEFNLLYRWHSLVPETIGTEPDQLQYADFLHNNPIVINRGIEDLLTTCTQTHSGRLGLLNTPWFLTEPPADDHPSAEQRTIHLMRKAHLKPYNNYRQAFGLKPLNSFEELTGNLDIQQRLKRLYSNIDNLEWYVGIFAEDYPDYRMMGDLMTNMVANDAFTQAFTNPLLAKKVFNADTFTPTGMDIIESTHTLQQIVERNSHHPERVSASFACKER
ncbi:peroxidase family protein [Rhodococcus koreensis]|uniref:peroxidase family protein n=1 Tax=Rhodococcus koreensis TaxID=99653 RepID=UPI003671E6CE